MAEREKVPCIRTDTSRPWIEANTSRQEIYREVMNASLISLEVVTVGYRL